MKELLRVEKATEKDRQSAIRLLIAQLREHGIDTAEEAVGRAVDGVLTDRSRGRILIGRDHDEAIAVAYVSFVWSLEHGGHAAWLEELYVVPERREGGIGTALLHAAVGVCRVEQCAAIDLEIESTHERATSLYEREGFTRHQRTRWAKRLV
jgi:GNAT superfamily N-acetyltransferase